MNRLIQLQREMQGLKVITTDLPRWHKQQLKQALDSNLPTSVTHYSLASNFQSWKDVMAKAKIAISLPYAPRLEKIIKNPSILNQNDEGNCGFASALMALLDNAGREQKSLKSKEQIRQNDLRELLNAIYVSKPIPSSAQVSSEQLVSSSKYKKLSAKSKSADSARNNISIIQNRIEKRLQHHPALKEVKKYLADYILIVGLMLFYKDTVKREMSSLQQELEKFNEAMDTSFKHPKIKDLGIYEMTKEGPKKGDYALTVGGMRELLRRLEMKHTYYSYQYLTDEEKSTLKSSEQNKIVKQQYLKESQKGNLGISLHTLATKNIARFTMEHHKSPIKWSQIKWPCIVGVYDKADSFTKRYQAFNQTKFEKSVPYNLLMHWIYMPDSNTAWTWGEEVDVMKSPVTDSSFADTIDDIKELVPMEIFALGK
ncbi:hypothetical protein QGP82_01715 [Leptothoe sp. LEGE 181152]|nr:hypothetical protein [Leptothoe sp. LEGE 181152]